MTLATSCPACGTVFKIVEDQLKVSEGWVRCGHCQEVFNALEGLFDLAGRERPALTPPAPPARPAPATTAPNAARPSPRTGARASSGVSARSPLASDQDSGIGTSSRDRPDSRRGSIWDLEAARQHEQQREASSLQQRLQESSDAAATPVANATRAEGPASDGSVPAASAQPRSGPLLDGAEPSPSRPAVFSASRRHPLPAAEDRIHAVDLSEADTVFLPHDVNSTFGDPFEPIAPIPDFDADEAAQVERWRPMAGSSSGAHGAAIDAVIGGVSSASAAPEPMPALPGFVRQADRAARWRQPGMRFALWLGCVCAVSVLALQMLLHYRDGAAARWPGLRGPLDVMCAPLDCTIQAPRQLDALVVENTALTRPAGVDGFRLQLLLRNHAEFSVLAPHVELSLTDASGAVVVRRVMAPVDFRQAETLAGNSEGNWQLELTSSDRRVAGYTVAVFYP
jgi:predicted Zn finger-like uncharacterized protein